MEIQTGENTLLLLMINSYLSFLSFTTKFFEFEIFPSPLSVEKVICAGNQNLLFHLRYLWARVEGWSDDSSFPFSLCAHLSV